MALVVKWMSDEGEVGKSVLTQTRGCAIVGSFLCGGEAKVSEWVDGWVDGWVDAAHKTLWVRSLIPAVGGEV